MADKKISQLTELTNVRSTLGFLPFADTSNTETKKIALPNLPISDQALDHDVPFTVTVSGGTGTINNFATADGFSYNSDLTDVYLGTKVTGIHSQAFYTNRNLTRINIPKGVTGAIGSSAFFYCDSLVGPIDIPEGVTSIGSQAFMLCADLQGTSLPDSLTSIGSYAFYSCPDLVTANIPTGITTIESLTFGGCRKLTNITIPSGVTSIKNRAFQNCRAFTSITIPSTVTELGGAAFGNCTGATTVNCLATSAPTISNGFYGTIFGNVAATELHVPVGATNYGSTYGGLTVVADL